MKTAQIFFFLLLTLQFACNPTTKDFPVLQQKDPSECGPICLQMIAQYYGKTVDLVHLKDAANWTPNVGTSFLGLKKAAESIGLKSIGAPMNYERLADDIPLPAIAHWKDNHFVVVYQINAEQVWIADPDPTVGKTVLSKADFCAGWLKAEEDDRVWCCCLKLRGRYKVDRLSALMFNASSGII